MRNWTALTMLGVIVGVTAVIVLVGRAAMMHPIDALRY